MRRLLEASGLDAEGDFLFGTGLDGFPPLCLPDVLHVRKAGSPFFCD
jgi:hypothetical protein